MIDPGDSAHDAHGPALSGPAPSDSAPSDSALSNRVLLLATMAGLLVAAASSTIIATLLDDVMGADDTAQLDPRILDWVVAHRTDGLTSLFRTVTHFADPIVVIVLATVATLVLLSSHHRRLALLVAASTAGTAAVTTVVKLAVDRARPPHQLWLGAALGPAYPSGHSAQSVALYGALAVVAWRLARPLPIRLTAALAALAIAVVVGASRVYLAVHWPSDVLSGWAVGALWLTTLLLIGWSLPRIRMLMLADAEGSTGPPPPSA